MAWLSARTKGSQAVLDSGMITVLASGMITAGSASRPTPGAAPGPASGAASRPASVCGDPGCADLAGGDSDLTCDPGGGFFEQVAEEPPGKLTDDIRKVVPQLVQPCHLLGFSR